KLVYALFLLVSMNVYAAYLGESVEIDDNGRSGTITIQGRDAETLYHMLQVEADDTHPEQAKIGNQYVCYVLTGQTNVYRCQMDIDPSLGNVEPRKPLQ